MSRWIVTIVLLAIFFLYLISAHAEHTPSHSVTFGVSDIIWQALIAALVTVVIAYMNYKITRAIKDTSIAAAHKVEGVKNTLSETTDTTHKKLDAVQATATQTHVLVNNNMKIQLKLNMDLSEWKARTTGLQTDKDAALASAKLYEDHVTAQNKIDAALETKKPFTAVAAVIADKSAPAAKL